MNPQAVAWSPVKRWAWALVAIPLCLWQGPLFVKSLWPPPQGINDFFQEWSSARNWVVGVPVYGSQEEAVYRHLGMRITGDDPHSSRDFNEVNAHPPTSVLLALPLAYLGYRDATLVWNLISLGLLALTLWLVARQLALSFSWWSVFPFLVLLLFCSPLRQQIAQGQLNLVLLALITAAWAAARSGYPRSAGALIGAAAAVKLFPAFLLGYFVMRRQWRAVIAGVVVLALLTGLTAAVLGPDSYRDYVQQTLPVLKKHWNSWPNASVLGFWSKLFGVNNPRSRVEPFWSSPELVLVPTAICCVVIGVALVGALRPARARVEQDLAFGLTVIAMMLVSPLTWDHYFLILLVPLAVFWQELPRSGAARITFRVILVLLWAPPILLYTLFIRPGGWLTGMAAPVHSLTVLSLQFYALVGLFVLGLVRLWQRANLHTGEPEADGEDRTMDAPPPVRWLSPSDALIHESHE